MPVLTPWSLRLACVAAAILVCAGNPAYAEGDFSAMEGGFVVGADVGFNLDPDQFAFALMGEYHVTENVAIGPLLQFGSGNDLFLFGTSLMAKYKATLLESERLKPYGQGGIGFLLVDPKHAGNSTEVLFPLGAGFEYWGWKNVALGANFLVNITDETYFSLLFGARYLF